MIKRLFFTIALVVCLLATQAQSTKSFVSKLWEQQTTNEVDTIDWSATVFSDDAVYVVGNTTNGFTTDVLVSKFKDGDLQWTQTFDGTANLSDYGTAGYFYNDRIYVCAATFESLTNLYDYTIIVYDNEGNLSWSTSFNGQGSGNDIPTAINVDDNGNIYVTGASQDDSTDYDYWTVKLDDSGNFEWEQYYDYAAMSDVPVTISLRTSSLTIAGVSAADSTNWDIYLINYTDQGAYVDDRRLSNPGVGRDGLTALDRDAENNYYLTGRVYTNSNYEILIVKLDSFLNIVWDTTYANALYDDVGNDIKVDAQGTVYVCGSLGRPNDVNNGILISYDSAGNEQWHRIIKSSIPANDCQSLKLLLTSDITLASYSQQTNDYAVDLTSFSDSGDPVWGYTYNPYVGVDEKPVSIKIDSEGVLYLVTRTFGVTNRYTASAFERLALQNASSNDTSFGMNYCTGQLIVRFNPDIVNTDFVNSIDKQYAPIDTVIPDSIISLMSSETGYDFSRDVIAVKVFPRTTLDDSISIARSGTPVRMKKIWSTFRLVIPDNWDMQTLVADLSDSTLAQFVMYAHPNYIIQFNDVPDDPLVEIQQESLILNINNDFPNANINMDPAWDIEHGQNTVRVGVLDHPVFWNHPDFGGATGDIADSKVEGGYDYGSGSNISNITSPTNSHGTACAGIIGALRNNGEGIAGIAGGDVNNDANTGCRLFSLGIFDGATVADVADAIKDGASETFNGGYGLHIENNSWGLVNPNNNEIGALADAVKFAARNECLFVASRGNSGLDGNPLNYPACFRDEWVLNVGATGTDGEHLTQDNGDNDPIPWESSWGNAMDLEAPGFVDVVCSTVNPDVTSDYTTCDIDEATGYTCFNGTSAAAPHVAGLGALMMSHHTLLNGYGNDLSPEDIEHLQEVYATDIVNAGLSYGVGYDDFNGFGRINAGATMAMIDAPHYRIFHNGFLPQSTNYTYLYDQDVLFTSGVESDYAFSSASYLPPGMYHGYRVARTDVYTYTFSSTTQIIDHWARLNSSTGLSGANPNDGITAPNYSFTINGNTATVVTVCYSWHLNSGILGSIDVWIPNEKQNCRADFSLHLFDPAATNVNDPSATINTSLYPVPATDYVNLSVAMPTPHDVGIEFMDVTGRLIISTTLKGSSHYLFPFDLTEITSGVYFCKITCGEKEITKKFVKL